MGYISRLSNLVGRSWITGGRTEGHDFGRGDHLEGDERAGRLVLEVEVYVAGRLDGQVRQDPMADLDWEIWDRVRHVMLRAVLDPPLPPGAKRDLARAVDDGQMLAGADLRQGVVGAVTTDADPGGGAVFGIDRVRIIPGPSRLLAGTCQAPATWKNRLGRTGVMQAPDQFRLSPRWPAAPLARMLARRLGSLPCRAKTSWRGSTDVKSGVDEVRRRLQHLFPEAELVGTPWAHPAAPGGHTRRAAHPSLTTGQNPWAAADRCGPIRRILS